jgi:hypothetical protein
VEDTSPEARARHVELLRSKSPAERLAQAASLTEAVRQLALMGIRQRHPGISEVEARVRLVALLYGKELAERFRRRLASAGEDVR